MVHLATRDSRRSLATQASVAQVASQALVATQVSLDIAELQGILGLLVHLDSRAFPRSLDTRDLVLRLASLV